MLVSPTIQSPHGRTFVHAGADPAAGAEISVIVPARRRWRLLGIYTSLVCDENEANRQIQLTISDGTNPLYRFALASVMTANLTYIVSFANTGAPEIIILQKVTVPLPPFLLPAGSVIATATTAIQATDNFSIPYLLIEEWIDP